jgi:hypothetical protein
LHGLTLLETTAEKKREYGGKEEKKREYGGKEENTADLV